MYRIGLWMSIFWIALAGIGDAASLIPVVGTIVGPIFWILFAIYGWKKGLGLINPKKLITTAVSMVAEIVPIVQELPALLFGVSIILAMVAAEDKTGISLVPSKKIGVTLPRNTRRPVNSVPGVRPPRLSK
jgi:hypothetical protein